MSEIMNPFFQRIIDRAKNPSRNALEIDKRDFTKKNNMQLSDADEKRFQQKIASGELRKGDLYDYDVRAWMMSGDSPDARGHGSDIGKKPNHPTFSTESMYSSPESMGGQWSKNAITGEDMFTPSHDNFKYRNYDELSNYFKKYEKDTKLQGVNVSSPNYKNALRGK
jgi:hypothetical protein